MQACEAGVYRALSELAATAPALLAGDTGWGSAEAGVREAQNTLLELAAALADRCAGTSHTAGKLAALVVGMVLIAAGHNMQFRYSRVSGGVRMLVVCASDASSSVHPRRTVDALGLRTKLLAAEVCLSQHAQRVSRLRGVVGAAPGTVAGYVERLTALLRDLDVLAPALQVRGHSAAAAPMHAQTAQCTFFKLVCTK